MHMRENFVTDKQTVNFSLGEMSRSQALKALDKNIIVAARDGKFESLIHMIDYLGVPVDFQESHASATPLMIAAQKGFVDILKYLLLKGANPNIQDREHRTPLITAVMNNHICAIQPLIESGANPNLYTRNGWTALYIAANRGFTSIVKELVSAYGVSKDAGGTTLAHKLEVDMDIRNGVGWSALMAACMQGHLEIVELLVSWGANVNARDMNKGTALMKAAYNGHAPVVAQLIKSGADVTHTDKSGFTALHLAAKANMIKVAEVLLSSNAAFAIINEQDANQRTALLYAAQNGHLEMVKLLMMHEAEPAIADKEQHTASDVAGDPMTLEELKNVVVFGTSCEKHSDAAEQDLIAVERGDPYGIYNMAVGYEEGIGGTIISIETAAKFYQQAAERGHAKAQVEIAMHYLNATGGVFPSDVMAAKYFKFAAEQNDVDGLYHLGQCLMHGRGVTKDTNTAVKYLERAAALEHACARIDLAFCLVCRQGTEKAVSRARSMLGVIISDLACVAQLVGLPTLAIIVPRWKAVDVSGYAMHEASSDYRLYFLDNTTKKVIEDKHYDITVSRQWLMDAAPVLKAGLLCLYLSGNSHLLLNVDLAMNVLQELPRNVYTPSQEVCCAGDSDAILRHAYQEIRNVVGLEVREDRESAVMTMET